MFSERFPQYVVDQIVRQWWNTDTPDNIEQRGLEEYKELLYEMDHHPDIAFLIAGEIGDIFYLAMKYERAAGELSPKFVAMIDHAMEICELVGFKPVHCVLMKILRNDFKYVPLIQNNGFNRAEATMLSKSMYASHFGGDEAFSVLWEEWGEVVTHDEPLLPSSLAVPLIGSLAVAASESSHSPHQVRQDIPEKSAVMI